MEKQPETAGLLGTIPLEIGYRRGFRGDRRYRGDRGFRGERRG